MFSVSERTLSRKSGVSVENECFRCHHNHILKKRKQTCTKVILRKISWVLLHCIVLYFLGGFQNVSNILLLKEPPRLRHEIEEGSLIH